jgi:hypothetical protein
LNGYDKQWFNKDSVDLVGHYADFQIEIVDGDEEIGKNRKVIGHDQTQYGVGELEL